MYGKFYWSSSSSAMRDEISVLRKLLWPFSCPFDAISQFVYLARSWAELPRVGTVERAYCIWFAMTPEHDILPALGDQVQGFRTPNPDIRCPNTVLPRLPLPPVSYTLATGRGDGAVSLTTETLSSPKRTWGVYQRGRSSGDSAI
jgi:hypothetical protein